MCSFTVGESILKGACVLMFMSAGKRIDFYNHYGVFHILSHSVL